MSETFRIGHLEVATPWGNAGGVLKHLEEVELMAHAGVGWEEAGSFTLEKRLGNGSNGEKVYTHNPLTGETGNSLGMPNPGFDRTEKDIPEMNRVAEAHNKALIINVAPVSNDPGEESQELVRRAYEAGAQAVIINAGCPNVVTSDGGRHEILSRHPRQLYKVLSGLRPIVDKYNKPVFVRISPAENREQMRQIIQSIIWSNTVGAVFTPNTWPGYRPLDKNGEPILEVPGNTGGLSGPATANAAQEQTEWALEDLQGTNIDVVRSGGIVHGKELHRALALGAAAACGTTFFYESAEEGWSEATDRLLRQYIDSTEAA